MSSPAASCALMIAATASRYCSRNSESPSAALNDRPPRLASYHNGRGYDPVMAVGSTMPRVVFNIEAKPFFMRQLGCRLFSSQQADRRRRAAFPLELGVVRHPVQNNERAPAGPSGCTTALLFGRLKTALLKRAGKPHGRHRLAAGFGRCYQLPIRQLAPRADRSLA